MEAVFGLLVVLLGVSHGVETPCDGRQDGAQCYGALGGTVVLRLMNSTSEVFKYQWLKNTVILEGRKNTIITNMIEDRSSFTPSDGTFRINKLSRTDGGEYNLTTFDPNGKRSEQRTLQLNIQAPVPYAVLDYGCVPQGGIMATCYSEEGDSPQYSWTLDGQTLTDAELLSGNNEARDITLKQNISGQLVCSVRNHISNVSTKEYIYPCSYIDCTPFNGRIPLWVLEIRSVQCLEGTITEDKESDMEMSVKPSTNITNTICGVSTAVVILILIWNVIYFASKNKKYVSGKMENQEKSVVLVQM